MIAAVFFAPGVSLVALAILLTVFVLSGAAIAICIKQAISPRRRRREVIRQTTADTQKLGEFVRSRMEGQRTP